MKLNEIRDPSRYRSGDELNSRSPYYKDPMDGVNINSFAPELIEWKVTAGAGKDKPGDEYSFTVVGRTSATNEDAQDMFEAINDRFIDKFPNYELVWNEDTVTNGVRTIVEYYQGNTPEANDPKIAAAMQKVLEALTQHAADEIAHTRAEKSVSDVPGTI